MRLCHIYWLLFFLLSTRLDSISAADPTLYEYYTSGGIKSGLEANHSDYFTLNGRPFVIFAGAFHYFRHLPQYWRRTLAQYRAAGVNTVQFYVVWDRHEDVPGKLDFESDALNLDRLLRLIKEEDMFAIVRPGPYICAEWEMGGLPSWLLRDPTIQLRTDNEYYLERVKLYWNRVMAVVNRHQFSVSGGPVLMVQLENEYNSHLLDNKTRQDSLVYMERLLNLTLDSGYKQLIFTSDNIIYARLNPIHQYFHALLETANFGQDEENLDAKLKEMRIAQPDKPIFVSEYWTGWFDNWNKTGHHQRTNAKQLIKVAEKILFAHNGSVNFYPFAGGSNFGFFNAKVMENMDLIVTTSYDYDAPISEGNLYTEKYQLIRQLHQKLVQAGRLPKLALPDVPKIEPPFAYGKIAISEYLSFEELLKQCRQFGNVKAPLPMELLNYGADYGQRFGFVMYRVDGPPVKTYAVTGPIRDRGILLVDGKQVDVMQFARNYSVTIDAHHWSNATIHTIDMLVENLGRGNYWRDDIASLRKGIDSSILVDGTATSQLTIYSLDFNETFIAQLDRLDSWAPMPASVPGGPAMYRATLNVTGPPRDTYLVLDSWTKGNVFVNGFNIGRYWAIGPQKSLYVPAPLLKTGANRIEVFELHAPGRELRFVDQAVWA